MARCATYDRDESMRLTYCNMLRKILKALVFIGISTSSHASTLCDRESPNTFAINACSEDDFKVSESRLNDVYKRVMSSLSMKPDGAHVSSYSPSEARKYLVVAQRAWIVFRDNDCLAKDSVSDFGTLRVAYFSCMQLHAEARTKQLVEYIRK